MDVEIVSDEYIKELKDEIERLNIARRDDDHLRRAIRAVATTRELEIEFRKQLSFKQAEAIFTER